MQDWSLTPVISGAVLLLSSLFPSLFRAKTIFFFVLFNLFSALKLIYRQNMWYFTLSSCINLCFGLVINPFKMLLLSRDLLYFLNCFFFFKPQDHQKQIQAACCLFLCSEGEDQEPLAVVGSPYWMAPEVLRGEVYNEKVLTSGSLQSSAAADCCRSSRSTEGVMTADQINHGSKQGHKALRYLINQLQCQCKQSCYVTTVALGLSYWYSLWSLMGIPKSLSDSFQCFANNLTSRKSIPPCRGRSCF